MLQKMGIEVPEAGQIGRTFNMPGGGTEVVFPHALPPEVIRGSGDMMTKEDIVAIFETDLSDPGSLESGEYLESHILTRAEQIVHRNRAALIEVLTGWFQLRTEPQTMLAVKVAGTIRLHDLRAAPLVLRDDVASGRVFLPFYAKRIDDELNAIGEDTLA